MMNFSAKRGLIGVASIVFLAACSEAPDSTGSMVGKAEGVAQSANEAAASSDSTLPEPGTIAVGIPRLAYIYDFTYRLADKEIGPLQRRHADLCERQGPASCRILGMSKSGNDGEAVTGQLQMAVATKHARAFGALLEDVAEEAGAQQLSAEIASEELSKQIVDTEAHLAARTELRDRLMEVLRTRTGKVSELVEAERSVAQVNEEIDQARSWLREMRGRVAYSTVTVHYQRATPVSEDFLSPIQGAIGSLSSVAGFVIAALLLLGAAALPVVALVLGGRTISRRLGRTVAEA
ncbi:MAG: DUF4349 domain-containing protein [Sphingomonadaceae bacterium]